MAEAALHVSDSHDEHLEALAKAAAILDWPLSRERDEAVCREAARVVDALLVRVARGRGALDVALGEALDVLGTGARVLDLGHSCVGDYALHGAVVQQGRESCAPHRVPIEGRQRRAVESHLVVRGMPPPGRAQGPDPRMGCGSRPAPLGDRRRPISLNKTKRPAVTNA